MGTSPEPVRRVRQLLLNVIGALSLGAGLVTVLPGGPAPAGAAPVSTFTSTPITVPDGGSIDRTVAVAGLTGRLIDVDVRLDGVSHSRPDDLDLYLTSPTGTVVYLASDAGGNPDVSGADLTFDDDGLVLPDETALASGTFRTANHGGGGDGGSVPSGATTNGLGAFGGEDPNGTWTLRAVDDSGGDTGAIAGGYTLLLQTSTFCNTTGGSVPDNGTAGAAGFVMSATVSGVGAAIGDVDVVVFGIGFRDADHLDAFVRAPNGDVAYLFSDLADTEDHDDRALDLDDEASDPVPVGPVRSGTWTPTNTGAGDGLPAGFTGSPGATLASVEDSTANGTWSVGIRDDDTSGPSQSVGGFCLDLGAANTPPTAAPAGDLTTDEDTALPITLPGSDPDLGQTLAYSITTQPAQGTITQLSGANWQYAPPADFNNPSPADALTFTYQVSDGTVSASASGTIRVLPVNDAPVAGDQSVTTDEDVAVGITLASTDVDGGAPTYTVVTEPANGTLSGTGADRTYTPGADFNGSDAFTFQVDDGAGGTDSGTVTITVGAVDDPPVADDDSYDASEDTPLVVPAATGVLLGDGDGDPELTQPLAAVLVTGPAHGVLVLGADGGFTYLPATDHTGADGFTYRASDGTSQSGVATVTIDVGGVNDAPTAAPQSLSTDEDLALPITLDGDDTDGDVLTFAVTADPANGSLSGTGADRVYTPDADFHGSDSFTFTVTDPFGEVGSATITIDVDPQNDAPTAATDAYTTAEDVALVVAAPGVLANDGDIDGDALAVAVASGPADGTLVLGADGSFTYTPAAGFNGADSFAYTVGDGTAAPVGPITVTIAVTPANDPPVATGEAYSVDEDTTLLVGAADGVLDNDTDPDGDPLTASQGGTAVGAGTLSLGPDGGFTYAPGVDFHGVDTFSYFVNDGAGGLVEATATITVTPVNDAPGGTDDGSPSAFTVDEDDTLVVAAPGVLGNDADADGDPLTAAIAGEPAHGTVVLEPDGSFTYVPDPDYHGPDSFTYRADDGVEAGGGDVSAAAVSAPVTVSIVVAAVPDAPVAGPDAATVAAGATVAVDVLANDTDVDGDPLAVLSSTDPARGTAGCTAATCSYTAPADDAGGIVTFDYVVGDGTGGTATATVSITVLAAGVVPSTTTTTPPTTTTTTPASTPTSTTSTTAPSGSTTTSPSAPTTGAVRAAGTALPRTGGSPGGVGGVGLVLLGLGCCAVGSASLLRDRRLVAS